MDWPVPRERDGRRPREQRRPVHSPAPNRPEPFRWQDGERLLAFGRGQLPQLAELVGDGYGLLTTRRARQSAPQLAERAWAVYEVAAGRVDEVAGQLRSQVSGDQLVALGGGRVVDVAKALAA